MDSKHFFFASKIAVEKIYSVQSSADAKLSHASSDVDSFWRLYMRPGAVIHAYFVHLRGIAQRRTYMTATNGVGLGLGVGVGVGMGTGQGHNHGKGPVVGYAETFHLFAADPMCIVCSRPFEVHDMEFDSICADLSVSETTCAHCSEDVCCVFLAVYAIRSKQASCRQ